MLAGKKADLQAALTAMMTNVADEPETEPENTEADGEAMKSEPDTKIPHVDHVQVKSIMINPDKYEKKKTFI